MFEQHFSDATSNCHFAFGRSRHVWDCTFMAELAAALSANATFANRG
jgi:hypothetical protein